MDKTQSRANHIIKARTGKSAAKPPRETRETRETRCAGVLPTLVLHGLGHCITVDLCGCLYMVLKPLCPFSSGAVARTTVGSVVPLETGVLTNLATCSEQVCHKQDSLSVENVSSVLCAQVVPFVRDEDSSQVTSQTSA